MNRFFVSQPVILGKTITLEDKEQVHHIKSVLHLKIKEPVVIFDRDSNEYSCLIAGLGEKVILDILEMRVPGKLNTQLMLTIACAIPKKSKFDDIVDKLTQLGVARLIPLVTERVIVKFDRRKESLRLERWRKIAQSAAEQSQRRNIPEISAVKTFKELLASSSGFDLKLIPNLEGERKSFKKVLKEFFSESLPQPINMLVLIGPEGDFSDDEINLAKASGFIPVTLGDLVLRVDTAAIAVVSFIRFYAND